MPKYYLCKIRKTAPVYESYDQYNPIANIKEVGFTFKSNKYFIHNTVTFYRVDEQHNEYDVSNYIGKWIPSNCLNITEIKEEENDTEYVSDNDSFVIDEYIHVNTQEVALYDSLSSLSTNTYALRDDNRLHITEKIKRLINGSIVFLGKISDPEELANKWIRYDKSITVENLDIVYNNEDTQPPRLRAVKAVINNQTNIQSNTDLSSPKSNLQTKAEKEASSHFAINEVVDANNMLFGPHLPNSVFTEYFKKEGYTDQDIANYDIVSQTNQTNIDSDISENGSADDPYTLRDMYKVYGFDYAAGKLTTMSTPIGRMLFVQGMPFQFTYLTDRRNGSTDTYGKEAPLDKVYKAAKDSNRIDMYGRTFAKEIVANMPVATIVPGTPKFLTNAKESFLPHLDVGSKNSINNWMPLFNDELSDTELSGVIDNLITNDENDYDYYSMTINTADYFTYVNASTRTAARMMGIQDMQFAAGDDTTKCGTIDWGKYNSAADQDYNTVAEIVGLDGGISVAFDPLASITDNMSNSLTQSSFAGMLNQASGKAREIEFLGNTAGVGIDVTGDFEEATAEAKGKGLFNLGSVFSNVGAYLKNTAHGMNVRFPQLWDDSSFNQDYSIECHFISPYNTAYCKWRYVICPFFMIFSLTAPISEDQLRAYKRPFLIRAFSKGYFNVEMGIIESFQYRRFGDGEMISNDGIPMQIDATISFSDLYQRLSMSRFGSTSLSFKKIGVFFNNTGLTDLIGTMSGVNMNRISISERLSLYAGSAWGAFSSTGSNWMRSISDSLAQFTTKWFIGM